MSLTEGTRLGACEITGQIGAGGMGEVYRAHDTALSRDVAVKVLPESFAADADRIARFDQEAKMLAALNHPNIAQIYGIERSDGTTALVMELVEGPTLAERIEQGPIAADEALGIAMQIADALEAAHGRGIVHRDLKPANIKLTPEGTVKVLDFGIAKALEARVGTSGPPAPSLTTPAMTQSGLLLGTAAYMAPEQARGKAVDQRADIWAFGCVLYEMLTGQPAFGGEDVAMTLARVLANDTDMASMPGAISPAVRHTIALCLEKDVRKRIADIRDVRLALAGVFDSGAPAVGANAARDTSIRRHALPVATAAVATAVVAGLVAWSLWPAPAPVPESGTVARFSIPLPDGQSLPATATLSMIALSPDGTRIAYVANNQIYLRNLAEREAQRVALGGADSDLGTWMPVFSPDGQWLAYVQGNGTAGPFVLKRVSISGGAPVTIHEAEGARNFQQGLTWPAQDTILFADADGIVRIPANGGATEVLVPRSEGERFFSPQLLPGGGTVLFVRAPGEPGSITGVPNDAQIVVQSIGSDDRTVVWDGGSAARYLPSGHLVYAQGATLFAIPFDPGTRAVHGVPVPVVQNLWRALAGFSDTANVAISDTGTLVSIPLFAETGNQPGIETTLTWVDRSGREEPLPVRPDDYTAARVSPDGKKVALTVGSVFRPENGPPSIWVYDLTTGSLNLRTGDAPGDGPVWSSDGSRIYYRSFDAEDLSVTVNATDLDTGETALVSELTADTEVPLPWTFVPGERTLVLVNGATANALDLATLSLADGEFRMLLREDGAESVPSISPDGAWLAYQKGAAGRDIEINIRPFPDVSGTRIPVGPGQNPLFSPDGSELFFFDGRGLVVAPVAYEPTLRVGAPQTLFESDAYVWNYMGRPWDLDPSGERFLMIRTPDDRAADAQPPRPEIDVVLNWFDELQDRVPTQ